MVMATSTDDMSTPVTRGELREELQHLEQKLEEKLEQKLALVATKAELEIWGGALLARIESGDQRLARIERVLERIDGSEQRMLAELARHTRASYEDASTQISAIDDKYADLPARVSQLEVSVFPTNRR
jgi:chromosome segregation ATPase